MAIQRKANYKVKFVFKDGGDDIDALVDAFSPSEFTREIGSYKNQVKGHLNPEGNASFGTATFTVAYFYNETENTTATLINRLYSIDQTVNSVFDVHVHMIENVGDVSGDERSNYITSLVGCKLAGIKQDDIGTEVEELMKATITVQPRYVKYAGAGGEEL
jgi:hypothetical protein